MTAAAADRAHHRRRFSGRDPHEAHRAATPLELLFDLTFVVAFGIAANELAHYVADGHIRTGLLGFVFASLRRLLGVDQLLVVRVGLRHRRLGLPPRDDGADGRRDRARARPPAGVRVDRRAATCSTTASWSRATSSCACRWSSSGRGRRATTRRGGRGAVYIWTISVAQVFWVVLAIVDLPIESDVRDRAGADRDRDVWPVHRASAEGRHALARASHRGALRPARDHHARRGDPRHRRLDQRRRARLRRAGPSTRRSSRSRASGSPSATWWTYFAIPWADVLELHRERSFIWGYGHMVIFGSLAAIGAGLHVAAYYLEHKTDDRRRRAPCCAP